MEIVRQQVLMYLCANSWRCACNCSKKETDNSKRRIIKSSSYIRCFRFLSIKRSNCRNSIEIQHYKFALAIHYPI